MECWACGEHHASARLSVRSLWPSATTGPSSGQGPPPSSAYTPALPVNTNAPDPSQRPSAARIWRACVCQFRQSRQSAQARIAGCNLPLH